MSRFKPRKGRGQGAGEPSAQAVEELLDARHHRASLSGGGRIVVEPGQVLRNISEAMERVDLDINTEISIEDDVAKFDEIYSMVQSMLMGPMLAAHVVNEAVRIMAPRYPADLVFRPLPAEYDVRKLLPAMALDDTEHDTAKRIFNRRLAAPADLTEDDVRDDLEPLDAGGQTQAFITLFLMYGHKVGAIKDRTGIE